MEVQLRSISLDVILFGIVHVFFEMMQTKLTKALFVEIYLLLVKNYIANLHGCLILSKYIQVSWFDWILYLQHFERIWYYNYPFRKHDDEHTQQKFRSSLIETDLWRQVLEKENGESSCVTCWKKVHFTSTRLCWNE